MTSKVVTVGTKVGRFETAIEPRDVDWLLERGSSPGGTVARFSLFCASSEDNGTGADSLLVADADAETYAVVVTGVTVSRYGVGVPDVASLLFADPSMLRAKDWVGVAAELGVSETAVAGTELGNAIDAATAGASRVVFVVPVWCGDAVSCEGDEGVSLDPGVLGSALSGTTGSATTTIAAS